MTIVGMLGFQRRIQTVLFRMDKKEEQKEEKNDL
jgi:hypothetical protein